MGVPTKYVVIDSKLGENKSDLQLLRETLENTEFKGKKILLLQFSKTSPAIRELLASYFDFDTTLLENKANSCDIKTIFEYFSAIEGKTFKKVTDKIRFGKKILYIDAVSNKFIDRFESNKECPGFWNLKVGTFCNHGCTYCFLNLTMRVRPLCTEHGNLSRLEGNLKRFNNKTNHTPALLNAGESSDPLDNEPLLHFWNHIVNLVHESGNRILCLTKSANIYSIPEADGTSLNDIVIYSWSINPPEVVQRYELSTAPTSDRLDGARHLRDHGYNHIRFRIDPILPLNLMRSISEVGEITPQEIDLESYYQLIDAMTPIEPEMVTMGTFRALPNLFNFLNDKSFKKTTLTMNGKRFRLERKYRTHIYDQLGGYAQDLLGCCVAICKDPSIRLPYNHFPKGPCQCTELNPP